MENKENIQLTHETYIHTMIDEDKILKKFQGKVIYKNGELNRRGRKLLKMVEKDADSRSEKALWMNYFRVSFKDHILFNGSWPESTYL